MSLYDIFCWLRGEDDVVGLKNCELCNGPDVLTLDTGDEFDDNVDGDEVLSDDSFAFSDEEFGDVDADGDHGLLDSIFAWLVCCWLFVVLLLLGLTPIKNKWNIY